MFFDTETTGVPDFKAPSEDPKQPHIVEFAAVLVDSETLESVASVHLVTRPDGWEIPTETTAIHGMTTARAMEIGVPERFVVQTALELGRRASLRVGHSQQFDARIVRIGLMRFGFGSAAADEWKAMPAECTAQLARPFTGLPKNKLPTLAEAFKHFTGRAFERAHTAKADTLACAELYWAIKSQAA